MTSLDPEFNVTVGFGIQRVILATTDIVAGMELGAALTYDDVTGYHDLATEFLDAQAFRLRIASVAGRARRFLVCHSCLPAYAFILVTSISV